MYHNDCYAHHCTLQIEDDLLSCSHCNGMELRAPTTEEVSYQVLPLALGLRFPFSMQGGNPFLSIVYVLTILPWQFNCESCQDHPFAQTQQEGRDRVLLSSAAAREVEGSFLPPSNRIYMITCWNAERKVHIP